MILDIEPVGAIDIIEARSPMAASVTEIPISIGLRYLRVRRFVISRQSLGGPYQLATKKSSNPDVPQSRLAVFKNLPDGRQLIKTYAVSDDIARIPERSHQYLFAGHNLIYVDEKTLIFQILN